METTQVSTNPGGPPESFGQRLISVPAASAGAPFRTAVFLRLTPGADAEELLVDAAGTELDLTFRPLTYDVIGAEASVAPAVVTAGASVSPALAGDLLVELDAPREVVEVTPRSSLGVQAGYSLEFYRLDGDAPAPEPSATSVLTPQLVHAGVSGRAVHASGAGGSAELALAGGAEAAELGDVAGTGGAVGSSRAVGMDGVVSFLPPSFAVAFTDRRFLIRLRDAGGTAVPLEVGDIVGVRVRGYPTNPRLGIAFPDAGAAVGPASDVPFAEPADAAFFWHEPGERTAPVRAEAGAALSNELDRAARRFATRLRDLTGSAAGPVPALPAEFDIALVAESDAPCRIESSALRVAYHMARASFPDGVEKRVLRYPAGRTGTEQLNVSVPAGAVVRAAAVELDPGLGPDRAALDEGVEAAPEAQTPAESALGIQLDGRRAVAQAIEPAEAVTLTGVLVELLALGHDTEPRLELREDLDGRPDGRTLGSAELSLAAAGERAWVLARFRDPVIVPARRHWLVLSAAAGSAVWIADGTDEARDPPRHNEPGRPWSESTALRGLRARFRPVSRSGAVRGQPPFTIAVGDHAVELGADEDGTPRTIELTAAVLAAVAADPETGLLPLRITATGPGVVTVYPPRIEYDLG